MADVTCIQMLKHLAINSLRRRKIDTRERWDWIEGEYHKRMLMFLQHFFMKRKTTAN